MRCRELGERVSAPRIHDTDPGHATAEHVGRVIENPISGERIIIRESGAQNGGERLVFDLFLPPGGHVPAGHTHPSQEERFTIVAGQMRFRLRGRKIIGRPGDTILIPAGSAHWFGADGPEGAQARVEVRPALRMQELFEETERSAQGAWLTRLTSLARIVLEFQREIAVPYAPKRLVRIAFAPLAWMAQPHTSGDAE